MDFIKKDKMEGFDGFMKRRDLYNSFGNANANGLISFLDRINSYDGDFHLG
jgi:hypothetical protein